MLLLHGLTGSPFEVRYLAEHLRARGMRCRGPMMPGHGGSPRLLANLPWSVWVEAAQRELMELEGARRILLVGCSMGALVACAIAHGVPEVVDGLALLAPAFCLTGFGNLAAALGRSALGKLLPPVPKVNGSDVRDPVARRENKVMRAVPLLAVAELQDLSRHVDALLPSIRVPALVVMGRHDRTVALSGARRAARRIGSGPAPLSILERSAHLVGIDLDRDQCAETVATFFETIPAKRVKDQGGSWRRT